MSARSRLSDSGRNYLPSDLLAMADPIIEYARKIATHEANKVLGGIMVGVPTTPSTQAVGAGNLDWNVDISNGEAVVNSLPAEVAETADFNVSTGAPVLAAGQSVIAAIVLMDTGALLSVVGTPATTGNQVAPTDPVITAAVLASVGANHHWIKIAECLLNRAADFGGVGVVTQSQNNGVRPILGVTVDGILGP